MKLTRSDYLVVIVFLLSLAAIGWVYSKAV